MTKNHKYKDYKSLSDTILLSIDPNKLKLAPNDSKFDGDSKNVLRLDFKNV